MIKNMTIQELKKKIESGEEIILVDCREKKEWDQGHLPSAQLLPLSEFQERFNELNSNSEIVVQCRSGKRSMNACQILLENDYANVANLEGGILAWEAEGHEIIKE